MKKKLLSGSVVILFIAYVTYYHFGDALFSGLFIDDEVPRVIRPANLPLTNETSQPSAVTPTNSASAPSTAPVQMAGKFKDGTYTGDVADAYYGNVQVRATVTNGRLTDVVFLDYPHDQRTSIMINTYAMPYLKQEAIQAQSAQVDTISGASETSRAFRESLGSALSGATL